MRRVLFLLMLVFSVNLFAMGGEDPPPQQQMIAQEKKEESNWKWWVTGVAVPLAVAYMMTRKRKKD